MEITSNLGQEIIKKVAKYVEMDINLMNLEGIIVASTNKSRINEIHSGALKVLESGNELIIDEQKLRDYPGTRQGVNLPIKHNGKLAGVLGVSGNPDEIYKFTGLIHTSVEIVLEQIHIERQGYFKERQWSYWLQQLLHPSGFDEQSLKEETEYSLRVNIDSEWRVIVLAVDQAVDHELELVRRKIKLMNWDVLFALPFRDEIIIAFPSTVDSIQDVARNLLQVVRPNCRIGIGERGFGLTGIRESYMLAKQALNFASKDTIIADIANWKLERLTAAIDHTTFKSVCSEYKSLLDSMDRIYMETIDTFFAMNLSIKKTADALHVHRNTLLYRFGQIHHKVGLDPRDFYDACILRIIRSRQT